MSITVKELRRSRSRSIQGEEREFMAWGSSDPDAIEAAVALVAPTTIGALVVSGYDQKPHDDDESVFNVHITYGKTEPQQPTETGGNDLSFELTMITSHVQRSLATVNSYGTDPPPMDGIGYDGEKYEGTDIQIPVFTFRITDYRAIENVNSTYISQLFQCASNPINDAPFSIFSGGEVMYVGASGSQRSSADFAITHGFAASPNLSSLSIGDISGIAKKGWEYLWVLYEKHEDEDSKFITEKPRAVYVEQMYGSSSFSSLLEIA